MRSGSDARSWRVLIALLVYNGEELVTTCLDSLSALDADRHEVDILVLDDASPAPGWSDRCRELCHLAEFSYYRSPRNLGIPRNMNLGLLWGLERGYDAVILLNADTIVPSNMVSRLIGALESGRDISSVTAWSNNVSIYSLVTERPELLADSPALVNWISTTMEREFGEQVVTIPSAVGFCMAIPAPMIREVGLMDPVFGRGYSEEIDWCLRSHALGYRSVLAPSCFVYHAGSGVNKVEGLVGGANRLMHAHQAIIDSRYPLYSSQIDGYWASSIPGALQERGRRAIVLDAARQDGYSLEAGWVESRLADGERVRFAITPDADVGVIVGSYLGFHCRFDIGPEGVLPTLTSLVGGPPAEVNIHDRGSGTGELLAAVKAGACTVVQSPGYNERVF